MCTILDDCSTCSNAVECADKGGSSYEADCEAHAVYGNSDDCDGECGQCSDYDECMYGDFQCDCGDPKCYDCYPAGHYDDDGDFEIRI